MLREDPTRKVKTGKVKAVHRIIAGIVTIMISNADMSGSVMRIKKKSSTSMHKFAFAIALVWTVVLVGLLIWNFRIAEEQTFEIALHEARAFFQEILTTRSWNASHGGVYVPVTSTTKPNPYLDDAARDVITDDGVPLTKINPAYMTRQISDMTTEKKQVWFHITSTNPIRPGNTPDGWEKEALEAFDGGIPEYWGLVKHLEGESRFRYMAPLWVEESCLDCHGIQGYETGDLRGGISVSIPAGTILASQKTQKKNLSITYFIIWSLGLLGITVGGNRLIREGKQREEVIFQLDRAMNEINRFSGLLPICTSCKKIRDDLGYWNKIEKYIERHTDARLRKSLCPECEMNSHPGDQDLG